MAAPPIFINKNKIKPNRPGHPALIKTYRLMKLRNLFMSLLMVCGISASCIKEDNSDCYNIYRLALSYLGDENSEIFPEKIDRVDMYVFDGAGQMVTSTRLSDAEVKAQLTTLPPLDEGTYRIVCVGNAYDTKVENLDAKDLSRTSFAAADYISGETVSGNDPLYWSAIDYTIAPYDQYKQIETRTTYFSCSHYDISVDVKGSPNPNTKAGQYPLIKLEGLSPWTDFNNRAWGDKTTYVMETTHDGLTTLTGVNNIMRHTDHQNAWVRVYTSDGKTQLAEVNFAEFLQQHKDVIDVTKNEVLIPFQIEFKSSSVTVTIADWFVHQVKPEWRQNNK